MASTSGSQALFVWILALSLILHHVYAWDCTIPPVLLLIKDNALVGGIVRNRGKRIAVRLSTCANRSAIGLQAVFPGNQILGLRSSFTLANTKIRNDLDCQVGNDTQIRACQGASGSTFDPTHTTQDWTVLTDTPWRDSVNITDPPLNGTNAPLRGIAKAEFDGGPTIDLPIEVWSDPTQRLVYAQQNPIKSVLGLGRNSSLLDRFLRGFHVPSTYIGLFFGSRR